MKNSLRIFYFTSLSVASLAFSAIASAATTTTAPVTSPPILPTIGTLVSQFPSTVTVLQPVPDRLRYQTPIDLGSAGSPGNASSIALSINKLEQVVGSTSIPPIPCGTSQCVYNQSFIWDSVNGMKLVGTAANTQSSFLNGINKAGVAVGTAHPSTIGASPTVAFTYSNGAITALPHLSVQPVSMAYAIDDAGKVVGLSTASNGIHRAVAWVNGTITDLGTLPGYNGSFAEGISDNGIVVGTATYSSVSQPRAVWWDNNNVIRPLENTPTAFPSFAHSVNNSGVAVGDINYYTLGYSIAVRYVNGQAERLNGNAPGFALDINNHGQIVGQYNFSSGGFLWDNGKFYDLSTLIPPNSGWSIRSANSINDRGEIVGFGDHHGAFRGFLLRPKP